MLKIDTYSPKGTKLTPFTLPKEYEVKENIPLLAQALRVYEDRGHFGLAKAKTRAEVEKTTKKWYRQKGTGGARHGAKSAPIFVGGGVAHGPRPVSRELNLPKKMARQAFAVAMTIKAKEGKILGLKGFETLKKTKDVNGLIKKIGKDQRFLFALAQKNLGAKRYLKNLKNSEVVAFKNLNAFKVYFAGILVLDKDVFEKEKAVKAVKAVKKETKK
jgi:large subunit ribosomal protein L4